MKNAPLRHALEHAAFAPWAALFRVLPHTTSRRLGAALGGVAHALDRGHRRVADENLRLALPALPATDRARIVGACFRHFGAAFADTLSAARFDLAEFCRRGTIDGVENLLAAEAPGRGIIVMAAHFGDWEAIPFYVALSSGPMTAVGRPADNPYFDRVVRRLRERHGNRTLDKRGSVRDMFRLLRDGGRLGLLIDQRVRASEAIDVPFFGRPALTSPIVARLALKTGASILPVAADHAPGGRYDVRFLPPVVPAGRDDDATTYELTARCLGIYETIIRRRPEHWLWLHRRWKH